MLVVIYSIIGYLLGSILFAKIFGKILVKKDITQNTKDLNPGVYNAFANGSMACGILTLICDLLKGIIPIALFFSQVEDIKLSYLIVVISPVVGHILPIWNSFKGGKGIATTFGCLIGLAVYNPWGLVYLVIGFLFFSLIIKISPNFYRTIFTYIFTLLAMLIFKCDTFIILSLLSLSLLVSIRMLFSKEIKEKVGVKFLWMH